MNTIFDFKRLIGTPVITRFRVTWTHTRAWPFTIVSRSADGQWIWVAFISNLLLRRY
ncbi:unnamed protein product [Rhodiola kirilowii]